jgi:hypothetical protein
VAITGDATINMQYDRYEKLIVVERGVELINWPDDVPFVNASDIGSWHTLRRLQTALTLDDFDTRCRWVTLSEEDWAKRKEAFFAALANAEPVKRKRKTKARAAEESNDESADEEEERPTKQAKRKKTSGKENDAPGGTEKGHKGGKGKGKSRAEGPRKAKGKNVANAKEGENAKGSGEVGNANPESHLPLASMTSN